ncbi:MAG: leucyl aminopeptidase [bacterium]|nr:leucyl aminopeptidase [bacterium]
MKVTIKRKPDTPGIEALVLTVFKNKGFQAVYDCCPGLETVAERSKFKGNPGESIVFNAADGPLVVAVGVGEAGSGELPDIVKCAKKIVSILEQHKIKRALTRFSQDVRLTERFWRTFLDYLFLSHYRFDVYRSGNPSFRLRQVGIYCDFRRTRDSLSTRLIHARELLSHSVGRTRDLVNETPDKANPDYMVEQFRAVAEGHERLNISVARKDDLEAQGLNGIRTVGRASPYEPALIRVDYTHPEAKKTVALVGKGVTFDAGGLNIKTGPYMLTMKSDMGGAGSVLGIMEALAALEIPVNVHAFAVTAENLLGQLAFKPGDIITYSNRKTVEIVNTDAEGRLMLADALILAAREKPRYMVEFSTLTGSVSNALGEGIAGLMCKHNPLAALLLKAAKNTGERLCRLPLPEDYKESIKSRIADLKNAGYGRASGIKAGLFLNEFTGKVPFAHIDIAGTAFLSKANSFYSKDGATGFGVRLMLEFLELVGESEKK